MESSFDSLIKVVVPRN